MARVVALQHKAAICMAAITALNVAWLWTGAKPARAISSLSCTEFVNKPIVPDLVNFTSHFCSGASFPELWWASDTFRPADWSERSCTFRHIAWDGNDSFVYYYDPARPAIWDFEQGSGMPIVNEAGAGMLETMFFGIGIKFREGPIPKNVLPALIPELKADDSDQSGFTLAVPGEIVDKSNFGHVLGDFVWPLFVRLVHLRFLSPYNTVLYHPPLNDSFFASGIGASDILGGSFLQALSKISLRRLKDYKQPTRYHLLHAGRTYPFSQRAWRSTVTKSPFPNGMLASMLREHAHCVMGLHMSPRPRPRVGIRRSRHPRHGILNLDEVVRHLQEMHPQIDLVAFAAEQFHGTSFEELRFMASLDVYITTQGGGSFSLVYLRDGASVIMFNPCWPGNHRAPWSNGVKEYNTTGEMVHCTRMEHFVWDTVSHVNKLYYAPYKSSPTSAGLVVAGDLGRYMPQIEYAYRVDLNHIDALLRNALIQAGFASGIKSAKFPTKSPM